MLLDSSLGPTRGHPRTCHDGLSGVTEGIRGDPGGDPASLMETGGRVREPSGKGVYFSVFKIPFGHP